MIIAGYYCLLTWVTAMPELVDQREVVLDILRVVLLGLVGVSEGQQEASETVNSKSQWTIDKFGTRPRTSPSYRVEDAAAFVLRRLTMLGHALQGPSTALRHMEAELLSRRGQGDEPQQEPQARCFGLGAHTLITVLRPQTAAAVTKGVVSSERHAHFGRSRGSMSRRDSETDSDACSHVIIIRDDSGCYLWRLEGCWQQSVQTPTLSSPVVPQFTPKVGVVPRPSAQMKSGASNEITDPLAFNARLAEACADIAVAASSRATAGRTDPVETDNQNGDTSQLSVTSGNHQASEADFSRQALVAQLVDQQVGYIKESKGWNRAKVDRHSMIRPPLFFFFFFSSFSGD